MLYSQAHQHAARLVPGDRVSRRRGRKSVRSAYQAKAGFLCLLGHPVRIRVPRLLQGRPPPVREPLTRMDIEPPALSQQLAPLRHSGIVTATREARP
jgi:hypothetical protein